MKSQNSWSGRLVSYYGGAMQCRVLTLRAREFVGDDATVMRLSRDRYVSCMHNARGSKLEEDEKSDERTG